MILQPSAKVLNHLFEQNSWAFARLSPFATRTIEIRLFPLSFTLLIQADGSLAELQSTGVADVVCEVSPPLLPRLALHDTTVFNDMPMTGDAALIETWRLVLSNLRWDAAEDLSRVTGDIAAERIVSGVEAALEKTQLRDKLLTLAQNGPVMPSSPVVKQAEFKQQAAQIEALQAQVAALQQRVANLQAGS